jgi:hypothetical protein
MQVFHEGNGAVTVAVRLPKLTADTNMLCSVLSLLNGWVVVQMGRDEKMSHCLYFIIIL